MATVEQKEKLKQLIQALHQGLSPEQAKQQFKEVLKNIGATDISQVEEEMIKEGMPREEIQQMCDVHLAVMKEKLEQDNNLGVAPGHPLHTFREEHNRIQEFLEQLKQTAENLNRQQDFSSAQELIQQLDKIAHHLMEVEKHNVREENVLFPYLEKYGIKEPPAIMWSEHDQIRELKKNLKELLEKRDDLEYNTFAARAKELAGQLADMLSSHIYKENNILYPAAIKVIQKEEWPLIRRECDELGYCCFTPESAKAEAEKIQDMDTDRLSGGQINLPTGYFSPEELELVLNTLPVDITYVDKNDKVRYFSESEHRIFPRSRAIIGREVQQCHPSKSIDKVNAIVDGFKKGEMDKAEFWLHVNDRLVFIRYFAVRDKQGEYMGAVEVTLDITDIKK